MLATLRADTDELRRVRRAGWLALAVGGALVLALGVRYLPDMVGRAPLPLPLQGLWLLAPVLAPTALLAYVSGGKAESVSVSIRGDRKEPPMSCTFHLVRDAGDSFRLRIVGMSNVIACVGRLRITGPSMGHTRNFTLAELEAGVGWELEGDTTYTLRVLTQPVDPMEASRVTFETAGKQVPCTRIDAGEIAIWKIDVL